MSFLARVDLLPIAQTAFMIEVPVNPEAVPVMVTGMDSFVWVPAAPKGIARTFIRPTETSEAEVIHAIVTTAEECQWGNVLPNTADGLNAGLRYLSEYGFNPEELEVYGKDIETDLPKTVVPIPYTILLPRDRSYLGWTCTWNDGRSTTVVHNAPRGVVILK